MIKKFNIFLEKITFQYHKELCPEFWTNFELDEKVRKKLIRIANDFFTGLKINLEIKDIRLPGSMANFNYTEYSDLDLHILVDLTEQSNDPVIFKKMLDDEKWIWNKKHDITIREHDVEIYVQDINEREDSSGVFSLIKNEWIKKPSHLDIHINKKMVKLKFDDFVRKIKELKQILDNNKFSQTEWEVYYDQAKKLKDKVLKYRKEGLITKEQEFSIENIVYKELRNAGWLDQIFIIVNKFYDRIFVQ